MYQPDNNTAASTTLTTYYLNVTKRLYITFEDSLIIYPAKQFQKMLMYNEISYGQWQVVFLFFIGDS